MPGLDTPHDPDAAGREYVCDPRAVPGALRSDALGAGLGPVPYLHVPAGPPLQAIRAAAARAAR